MKLLKNSKQIGGMQAFILGLVGVAVVLAVGLIVLGELQTTADLPNNCPHAGFPFDNVTSMQCQNQTGAGFSTQAYAHSTAYNSTSSILTKLATVPTWIGIIIVVALAFIVLGYFYTRQ